MQHPWATARYGGHRSGCWVYNGNGASFGSVSYLRLHSSHAHATIKDVTSRTVLTQTFANDTWNCLENVHYSFPLYDGVSVVSFNATIGGVRIHAVVKEKAEARREYNEAVERGAVAGLLEQHADASDVFNTSIGNVPAGTQVQVEVVYIGELKHDAQSNAIRFTIPASIAPRYGTPHEIPAAPALTGIVLGDVKVTVDFQSPEGRAIQTIKSPSHPISVTIGRTSDMPADAEHMSNYGSATLSTKSVSLIKDFIFIADIKDSDKPQALMETHSNIPGQRALMATLVPRFNLTPTHDGELVFVVDRSGSMSDEIEMVIEAMKVLLKSLPVGIKFNICSFGNHYSFLWPHSKKYDDSTLAEALRHVHQFKSDMGGTNMAAAVEAVFSQRLHDTLLDVILLTDGQIWNQDDLFQRVETASTDFRCRFFSLGIGSGVSTALVEGIATAGRGFSQFVDAGENMNAKMVRLLKGALSPRIVDYSLEVRYKSEINDGQTADQLCRNINTLGEEESDLEIIEPVQAAATDGPERPTAAGEDQAAQPEISFFDKSIELVDDSDAVISDSAKFNRDKSRPLPAISSPSVLQAPHRIPPLYPFSRTTIYLLLDSSTQHRTPEAIILRARCSQGPLKLEIEVKDFGTGETIHQLAAKKAVADLEKNGGWLSSATDGTHGTLLRTKYEGDWDAIVQREAVRLGVKYQIAGKFCSFVAVEDETDRELVEVVMRPRQVDTVYTDTRASDSAPTYCSQAGSASDSVKSLRLPSLRVNRSRVLGVAQRDRQQRGGGQSTFPVISGGGLCGSSSVSQLRAPPSTETESVGGSFFGSSVVQPLPTFPLAMYPAQMMQRKKKLSRPPPGLFGGPEFNDVGSEEFVGHGPDFDSPEFQPPAPSHDDLMQTVIQLQKSDGSWIWDLRLHEALGIPLGKEVGRHDAVGATTYAVAFLLKCLAKVEDDGSYDLILDKAKAWLGQHSEGLDVEKEISDARQVIDSFSAEG